MTTVEYEILSRLTEAAGSVIARQQLVLEVFERQFNPDDRALDVHIHRLRKKLGPYGWLLVTVRGSGHMLRSFAIALTLVIAPLAAATQESATVHGDWTLNRDLTPAPPQRNDDLRRPEGRRPPGGGGGFPGGGGSPGGGFGGGGLGGARRGTSEKEMRKLEAVRRRIDGVPQRLVISIDGVRVQVVDELGRTTNLVADGKKQDRLTGDGEFKSITRLEGARLVVEEDFGGPKVTTTYQRLTSDGESRLHVTLQIDGTPEGPRDRGRQGAKAPITRIYETTKQAP